MASKITTTDELQVELLDASGEYRRVLKIPNPRNTVTTKAAVEAALAPAFAIDKESSTGGIVPFFYDDNDATVGLTRVGSVQHVQVRREETELA